MTTENFEDSAKVRELIQLVEQHQKGELSINKLPYATNELEPVMSEATINYHYGELAKGYVKRYNAKEGDPYFNHLRVLTNPRDQLKH
jgi:superoxide dismutase